MKRYANTTIFGLLTIVCATVATIIDKLAGGEEPIIVVVVVALGLPAALLGYLRDRSKERPGPRLAFARPPLFKDVDMHTLGVSTSSFDKEGQKDCNPYIARMSKKEKEGVSAAASLDAQIGEAVAGRKPIVIVEGERLAGTSRSLAEAAIAQCGDCCVLLYEEQGKLSLGDMASASRRWQKRGRQAIVWIEKISAKQLAEIDSRFIEDLPPGLRIFATRVSAGLEAQALPDTAEHILEDSGVRITLGALSGSERKSIADESYYASLLPLLEDTAKKHSLLMGKVMGATKKIEGYLKDLKDNGSTYDQALLYAVTDWERAHMPDELKLDKKLLKNIYEAYWHELTEPDTRMLDEFNKALKRAVSKSTVKNLHEPLLQTYSDGSYGPHPLLTVIANDIAGTHCWPVGRCVWDYAAQKLEEEQRLTAGLAAYELGDYIAADKLLEPLPLKQIGTDRMVTIARALEERHDLNAVRRWLNKAIAEEPGSIGPKYELARFEVRHDEYAKATRLWSELERVDIPELSAEASVRLGDLYADRENPALNRRKAIELYKKGAASKYPQFAAHAMLKLGILMSNWKDKSYWYKRVLQAKRPEYSTAVCILLATHAADKRTFDRDIYTMLIEVYESDSFLGHQQKSSCLRLLGQFEAHYGNTAEAIKHLNDALALESDDIDVKYILAKLYATSPDIDDLHTAERLYREVIVGELETAASWENHPHQDVRAKAMNNLGILLRSVNPQEAEYWLQQAAVSTKDDEAASRSSLNLGDTARDRALANDLKGLDEAIAWYRKAISFKHPETEDAATLRLGRLLVSMPDGQGEGLELLRKARKSKKSWVAAAAKQVLHDLKKQRLREHFDAQKVKK